MNQIPMDNHPMSPMNGGNMMQGGQPYPQQPAGGYQNPNLSPYGVPQQPGQGMPPMMQNKQPSKKGKKKGKKGSSAGYALLGILLMFVLIGFGGWLGYKTAINARKSEESRQKMTAAAEQYRLALADIEAGKLENAKTRLEWVLHVDSAYPGASESYQNLVIQMATIVTPTPFVTDIPLPTATPDLRGEEEMFNGIRQTMGYQNWAQALEQMDTLRDKNIDYRAVEVDGMYYIALRNEGIQLINSGYLESGVYKITEAESFGPIDFDAESMRVAARSYLAGAGFWEIDWDKAVEYYSNAAASYGSLYDRATGMTAQDRYIKASFEVGDRYVETEDYCGAVPYYAQALAVSGDEMLQATGTAVYITCHPEAANQEEGQLTEGEEGGTTETTGETAPEDTAYVDEGIEFVDPDEMVQDDGIEYYVEE